MEEDPPHKPRVCQSIHFPRNDEFVQRALVSEQIARLLPPKTECQSAAIWGLGGSGKTQIALDYAYSRCSDPSCSVFWVHADTKTSFAQDYKDIAVKLGLPDNLDGDTLLTAVRNHIQTLPQWVLILDNADDLTLFGVGRSQDATKQGAPDLSVYVPRGPVGTVLWTSRDKQIVGSLVGPRRGINAVPMTSIEAETLFQAVAVVDISEGDTAHDDMTQLLIELDCLPLAITQVAAYIRRTRISIGEYLEKIRQRKERWKALRNSAHDPHRRPEASNSVMETWNISMEYIQQQNKMAYDILSVLAYVDNQNIPFAMIKRIAQAPMYEDRKVNGTEMSHQRDDVTSAGNSPSSDTDSGDDEDEDVVEAVIRLEEFSFLTPRVEGKALATHAFRVYDMHKLVQEAISFNLHVRDFSTETQLTRIAFEVIDDLFPRKWHRDAWGKCEQYLGHTQRTVEWAQAHRREKSVASLLIRVSHYLDDMGFWR
ncbi:hypothetical protein JX266_009675 [Neoarthrinium moseri]|nr:hypothetical protein JX266_009675 [Neoarthrinium moseri]